MSSSPAPSASMVAPMRALGAMTGNFRSPARYGSGLRSVAARAAISSARPFCPVARRTAV